MNADSLSRCGQGCFLERDFLKKQPKKMQKVFVYAVHFFWYLDTLLRERQREKERDKATSDSVNISTSNLTTRNCYKKEKFNCIQLYVNKIFDSSFS